VSDSDQYSSSDAADYGAEDIKQHFVELLETEFASEASALAAKLRRAGIIALANAEPYPKTPGARGNLRQDYRTFVMVFASDLDLALELLNTELGEEGDVPFDDIAQDMHEALQDPESATAWYYEGRDKGRDQDRARRKNWRLLGLFSVIGAVAWFYVS
tara:strand:+ start:78594 stop:79070 length:477 start_codon:yes stop_codon:yes gene_type:complete